MDRRPRGPRGSKGWVPRLIARTCVIAAVGGWTWTARAHTGYPAVVDTALGVKGVSSMIAPPSGCQLCHVSPAGGTTQLGPFGTLLVTTYGLVESTVEQDPSLVNALARLKTTDPKLFMDMAKGIDPNSDRTVVAQAPPHPEYGCALRGASAPPPPAPGWLVLLALFVLRRGRARQRSQ
jgi:hypothetical protein